jgi:hypothetical protein
MTTFCEMRLYPSTESYTEALRYEPPLWVMVGGVTGLQHGVP